jgi:hypothetical protein
MGFFTQTAAKFPEQRREGKPLPLRLLSSARTSFDRDFSHVRVATGVAPGTSGGTLATAYGDRILLDPSLAAQPPVIQDFVLAHELAHVAQQERGRTEYPAADLGEHEQAHLEANANVAALDLLAGRHASVVPAPLTLSRCARPAGTLITAAHFRFRTTVPIRPGDGDPAGWQAAQIRARMSKDVGGASYGSVVCQFEVGVPLRNHLGPVSAAYAAEAAAMTANSAAYTVLADGTPASAAHCIAFRALMEEELRALIPGARVGPWVSPGLTPVDFP